MMEKFLEPKLFNTEPNTTKADQEWIHWLKTFENFIACVPNVTNEVKLQLLTNHVSHDIYGFISESESYDNALQILNSLYIKPRNEIYARHKLATRKQLVEETIDQYTQVLIYLSKDCNFQNVSAEQNRNEFIRDAFISGLNASEIRQRLLENNTLTLDETIVKARTLEAAQKHSAAYSYVNTLNSTFSGENNADNTEQDQSTLAVVSKALKCYFCGKPRHLRSACPARELNCKNCGKVGHFAVVCRSKKPGTTAALCDRIFSYSAAAPRSLSKSLIIVYVNNKKAEALVDTGSSESFVSEQFVKSSKLYIARGKGQIFMASTSLHSNIAGYCHADIKLSNYEYPKAKLSVLPNLCADVIIGHDILKQHSKIEVNFGGAKPPLRIFPSSGTCGISSLVRKFNS